MLTDPVDALAEQSPVLDGLLGMAGLSTLVRELAADAPHQTPVGEPDDVVYVLLGVVGLGEAVRRLAGPAGSAAPPPAPSTHDRWLR